ncbi:family 78 glycoside hydrolase catalytic domain [Nocardioides flavescens]|uniref:family 78 glycoside hydrolase catalytic domain n=1 Tax=Nocardioides flavescens TaxID=2691959 RepID=UPI001927DE0B
MVAGAVVASLAGTWCALLPTSAHAATPLVSSARATTGVEATGLTTNGRREPLGIGGADPTFGWQLESARRGVTQQAYEVRVGTSAGAADVWSSGKVTSPAQTDVVYDGPALTSATRYTWQVRVWDDQGTASEWSTPAHFETGLLTPADWGSAAWIGNPAASYADWTDYTADVTFHLNNGAFGTYLRAKDLNNALMWQLNVGDRSTSVPLLRPHAKVNGGYSLLGEVDLRPFGFTRAGLLAGSHTFSFKVTGTSIETRLDGVLVDTRNAPSVPSSGRVGIRTYGSESVDLSAVKVVAAGGSVLAQPDLSGANPFGGGTPGGGVVRFAGTIDALMNGPESNAPLLRTTFTTAPGKTIASARAYASAHGVYQLQLNGQKVGDQFLAPGYTEYDKRIQAQTYDITSQVVAGQNALGGALGDGWWAGKIGLAGKGGYGTELALVARVAIRYTDGTVQWVDTDPSSWRWAPGPLVANDLQIGETYDARLERRGWDRASFDDSGWRPTVARTSDTAKLAPQPDEPVRVTGTVPTRAVTTPQPGATVYDLGQNMVGVAAVTLSGKAGETVRIRHAEVLNPNGTLYTANLRAASATDYYTFAQDGTVTYQPTFTQHGFRYVEITGASTVPAAGDVVGVVLGSYLPVTGTMRTSDAMLNQLTSNVSWGARGNFLSIPTDTPARDERLGWTGDINVFGPTASYLFDTRAFLGKWMTDVRDEQKADGQIPAVVPSSQGAFNDSGPGWQDAVVAVPYALYRAYGDVGVVRDNWAAMTRFYDFAAGRIGDDNLGAYAETFFTTTDWLSLDNTSGRANDAKTTAIWADTVRMMAELAKAVDDPRAAEYAASYQQVKRDFVAAYVASDGTVAGGSQTGYALALGMGLIDDPALKTKVGEQYVATLAQAGYHLRTGFIGTPWLLPALSAIGREDLAYTLLLQKDYPSWGYEIAQGATTIWERWNSIQPDGSFGPVDMNSFNHYAYGAVADWMHQNIAGIAIGEPGYRRSIVAPRPGGGLTSGAGTIDTVYGDLSTDWELTAAGMSLDVVVPAGTTSEVRIPTEPGAQVTESGRALDTAPGVTSSRYDATAGVTVVEVGSGHYDFTSTESLTLRGVAVKADGERRSMVTVTATNNGTTAFSGRVQATAPAGWPAITPSRVLDLAPGASATVTLAVAMPYDAVAGSYAVPLSFGSATTAASVVLAPLKVPPTGAVRDHVDFGEATSEHAHAVAGSPSSGTSSEAGLTRRYANNNNPGAYFTATVAVEPRQPFVLLARETWNTPGTKDYDVYVDDRLVRHVRVDRGESGQGVTSYQFLVDDAQVLDNEGTVTVRYQFPETTAPRQYYDPSIADLWVLDAPDTGAPAVALAPADGTPAPTNGWYTTAPRWVATASDDRKAPAVEVRTDGGPWAAYTGPVLVGDGDHLLEARATDGAGNVSEIDSVRVRVDTVAPVVTATLAADRTLTVTASDANLTGTDYRVDDGSWQPYTAPVVVPASARLVRYRATDRAGLVTEGALDVTVPTSPTVPTTPTDPQTGQGAAQAPSQVLAHVVRRVQRVGKGPRAAVRFTVAPGTAAGGTLVVTDGGRTVARVTVDADGVYVYRLPKRAARGKHRLVATFSGNSATAPSTSTRVTVKVVGSRR